MVVEVEVEVIVVVVVVVVAVVVVVEEIVVLVVEAVVVTMFGMKRLRIRWRRERRLASKFSRSSPGPTCQAR